MAKYQAKAITVEAWHFEGGYFAAVDLLRNAGYGEECIGDYGDTLRIPPAGYPDCSPITIRRNEWLIRHSDGSIGQYDEAEFDAAFEPAGDYSPAFLRAEPPIMGGFVWRNANGH